MRVCLAWIKTKIDGSREHAMCVPNQAWIAELLGQRKAVLKLFNRRFGKTAIEVDIAEHHPATEHTFSPLVGASLLKHPCHCFVGLIELALDP